MKQKLLLWILTAVYVLCVILSWLLPEFGVHASVLPLNTVPLLIVVGGAVSGSAFVGCVVSMVVLYGLLIFGLLLCFRLTYRNPPLDILAIL